MSENDDYMNNNIYYHGSNSKFEKFDLTNNKTYKEFDVPSWFFTKDIEYAKSYGKFLYTVKLNIKNTFDTSNPAHYKLFINQLKEWGNKKSDIERILDEQFYNGIPYWTCGDAFYTAKAHGFDSILIQEELEREVLSVAVFNTDDIEVVSIEGNESNKILHQINENDDIDWDLYDLMNDVKYQMFGEYISAVKKESPDPENGKYLKARQSWEVVPFVQLKTVWEAFIDQGKVPDRMMVMLDKIEEVITENICKLNINTEMAGHSQHSPKEEWRQYLEGQIDEDKMDAYIDYLDSSFVDWIEEPSGQMRISDYGLDPLNKKLSELRKIGIPEKKLKKIDEILNVVHQRSDIAGMFIEGGSRALSQLSGMEEDAVNEVRKIVRKTLINEAKKSKFEKLKNNKVPLTDEEREKVMTAKAVWHHGPNGEETPAVWKSKDKKTGKVTYACHTHRLYQTAKSLGAAINKFHKYVKQSA